MKSTEMRALSFVALRGSEYAPGMPESKLNVSTDRKIWRCLGLLGAMMLLVLFNGCAAGPGDYDLVLLLATSVMAVTYGALWHDRPAKPERRENSPESKG